MLLLLGVTSMICQSTSVAIGSLALYTKEFQFSLQFGLGFESWERGRGVTQSNEWCSIGFHCRTVPLDAPEICHKSNHALLYKPLSVIFVNITISEKINFVLFTLRYLFKCYKALLLLSKSVVTEIVKAYNSTYLQQIYD